jgi:hypothetical protein
LDDLQDAVDLLHKAHLNEFIVPIITVMIALYRATCDTKGMQVRIFLSCLVNYLLESVCAYGRVF